jgi:repressor LexA
MKGLTTRQKEVLATIRKSLADFGWPPTRVEIAKAMGFASPNAAEEHLKALAKKGYIIMTPGMRRGIRIAS